MVRIGVPSDIDKYYVADDYIGLILHRAGFIPKYKDAGCLFFKKNKKLVNFLKDFGIDVDYE